LVEAAKPEVNMKLYRIVDIIRETPDVNIFKFKADDATRIGFSPGMFMMVTCVKSGTNEKITRAFSLASLPDSDTLDFFISMVHGKFTSNLDTAKIGDGYLMTGAYGNFKFDKQNDKKVLFIAGGTGLAPFMSMLRQIKEEKLGTDVSLLYSVRFPPEIIRKGELEEMESQIGLKTVVTVTRHVDGDGWTGEGGHIDQNMIIKYSPDVKERVTYVCGPLGFVKAVKDALIAIGCAPEKIKVDVWG
jgi:glycine betaine catabolism B